MTGLHLEVVAIQAPIRGLTGALAIYAVSMIVWGLSAVWRSSGRRVTYKIPIAVNVTFALSYILMLFTSVIAVWQALSDPLRFVTFMRLFVVGLAAVSSTLLVWHLGKMMRQEIPPEVHNGPGPKLDIPVEED